LIPNVGAAPTINTMAACAIGSVMDVVIQRPGTMGVIDGLFSRNKIAIASGTELAMFLVDPVDEGTITVGPQYSGLELDKITYVSPLFDEQASMGVLEGGVLSRAGGLLIQAEAGNGYLGVPEAHLGGPLHVHLKYVPWNVQNVAVSPNSEGYVYVDASGVLQFNVAEPDPLTAIILGRVRSDATDILFIQEIARNARNVGTNIDTTLREALGPIYVTGSIVSKVGDLQLAASQGLYFYSTYEFRPAGGSPIDWYAFYRDGGAGYTVVSQNTVDYQRYDDGSGILAAVPVGQYARHALYVVGDGVEERYLWVYGREIYPTLLDAQNGSLPPKPGSLGGSLALIASVVTKNSAIGAERVAEIRDERPRLGFKASGISVVTEHGDLGGLANDDHTQYLLANGSRSMSGLLQMAGNQIVGAGLVNGVDVAAHSARHQPGGADSLPTGVPVDVGSANAEGIQNTFARADHIHAHGNHPGGVLHAASTAAVAGFMSAADKAKLDALNSADYVHLAGDTMTGPLDIAHAGARSLIVGADRLVVSADTGEVVMSALPQGVVHARLGGVLESDLVVDGDIDPASDVATGAEKALQATNLSLANRIVQRDASGNFSANTITATLQGTATAALSAVDFSGLLTGDVTGTQSATIVAAVGGQSAASVAGGVQLANAATSLNSANTIVRRDASGNFAAGTITANLSGNATTATTANSFSGTLAGDVTGTQGATTVALVGGQSAASVAGGVQLANAATSLNSANTIVRRDASGNFVAGTITANLSGNATTATTANSFSGALAGDVTGTQGATTVALVGGQSAANVASGVQLANASTSSNTLNAIVRRDASGNFAAGMVTANLVGNVMGNVSGSAATFTGALSGDVTGTQGATTVALVGAQSAVDVANATLLANAATSANTPNTLVRRDASGNFLAGTVTANLVGSASQNVLKSGDTMTGSLVLSGGGADLTVGGDTLFENATFFNDGVPALPHNTIQVTKGVLSGPNQFASIKAAVDSITTASSVNPFIVQVGPGVYVEDTITLKPYVYLTGSGRESTIIQPTSTSQDVVVGSGSSWIMSCRLEGATGGSAAAIRFNGGGVFDVRSCSFGSSNTLIRCTNTTAPYSFLRVEDMLISGDAQFVYGLSFDAAIGAVSLYTKLENITWLAQNNAILDTFLNIGGPLFESVISDVHIGTPGGIAGIACAVSNGAKLRIQSALFMGFDTGLFVPNVGIGPEVNCMALFGRDNTQDVDIQNPGTVGVIDGVLAREKVAIASGADLAFFAVDPEDRGTVTAGPQYAGLSIDDVTYVSPLFNDQVSTGILSGGAVTVVGGLDIQVALGTGYLLKDFLLATFCGNLWHVQWATQNVPIPAESEGYIFIDVDGMAQFSLAAPCPYQTIPLARVRSTATNILYVQELARDGRHIGSQLDTTLREALGPIYVSGSLVAKASDTQLSVAAGRYFYSTHEYLPSGGSPISWSAFYRDGGSGYNVVSQSVVDYTQYDDGTGALAAVPLGKFIRHALYVVGDGVQERYLWVYGRELFDSLIDAQNGSIPPEPATWAGNIVLIASIITENSAVPSEQIAEIRDERPRLGFKASGLSVVTNHGDLSGLANDDHPQYLLVNGTRAMSGSLDLGGNAITNTGLINGVTLQTHASRHLPNGGADALATAAPSSIGASNQEGIANSFARSDHVHNHGDLAGGSLHSAATPLVAGFMSAADKTLLDSLDPSLYLLLAGGTMTGPIAWSLGVGNALEVNTNKFVVDAPTGNTSVAGTLQVDDSVILSDLGLGVVHADALGTLTSSLIVDADVDPVSSVATGAALANAATHLNTSSAIVRRDASGNFAAGTVTANLIGNVTGNVSGSSSSFTGLLSGDVTGTQGTTTVALVGGQTAVDVAAGAVLANESTASNIVDRIVRRDAGGNFSAGTVTANLLGNATSATTAINFTGLLSGDVTGTQAATSVAAVGGQTAANVAAATVLANSATHLNTANTIVRRDAGGNFAAGTITANVIGNATTSTTATNFSGVLSGDITGTQGATAVTTVGGQTATDVAAGTVLANSATYLNTPSAIVRRDASGNFAAGTITANLLGNATTATTATNFSGVLSGDVTGTQGTTVVAAVGGQTATDVAAGTVLANAATHLNTPSAIVRRDASGNFAAGTITANVIGNVTGNLTGSASNNVLKAGDTMTGTLTLSDQSALRLGEQAINGTDYVALQASASMPSPYTLTLPPLQGGLGQTLVNDGAGTLSWASVGGSLSRYTVHAYLVTSYTLPSNTTVTMPFNAELVDLNGDFNTGTYTYTVPVTGYYWIAVNCYPNSGNNFDREVNFVRNGTNMSGYGSWWRVADVGATTTGIVSLTAGDLFSVRYTGRSGDVLRANQCSLSIQFLTV